MRDGKSLDVFKDKGMEVEVKHKIEVDSNNDMRKERTIVLRIRNI